MPTDKEAAAAWRTLAEKADEQGLTRLAIDRRRIADALDPPKPSYADGHYLWTYTDGSRVYVDHKDGLWLDCHGDPDKQASPGINTIVEPLRVLGDDEIALPRAAFGHAMSSEASDFIEKFGYIPYYRSIWSAYRASLEAEAGDRS